MKSRLAIGRIGLKITKKRLTLYGASLFSIGVLLAGVALSFSGVSFIFKTPVYADSINTTDFVTKWKTDENESTDTTVTIPTTGSGYNYDIDWNNDGVFDDTGVTGSKTYTYDTPGEKTIRIRGTFPRIYTSSSSTNAKKLIDILQWGNNEWLNMSYAFAYTNLGKYTGGTLKASDTPDTTKVTDMSGMFYRAAAFNQPLHFDTSKVTDMRNMLNSAAAFNQPLDFDTSSVSRMDQMFEGATSFNQAVEFDTSNVTNMTWMFSSATSFNQPLNFDISKVTSMDSMLNYSGMSTANYSITLSNWEAQAATPTNITLGAKNIPHCSSTSAARQRLIDNYNWTFSGDINACQSPSNIGINGTTTNLTMPAIAWPGWSLYYINPLKAQSNVPSAIKDYDKITFEINCSTPGTGDRFFEIVEKTEPNQLAVVTTEDNLLTYDPDGNNTYTVCIKATNILGNSTEQYITYTIQKPNSPYLYAPYSTSYRDKVAAGTDFGSINPYANAQEPFQDIAATYEQTCGEDYFEVIKVGEEDHLVLRHDLAHIPGGTNEYTACFKTENINGGTSTTEFTLTIAGPPVVTGVSFYKDTQGRKMMTVNGDDFMGTDVEMYRLYFATFIKMNGSHLPMCLQNQSQLDEFMGYLQETDNYFQENEEEMREFLGSSYDSIVENATLALENRISLSAPCYMYYEEDETTEEGYVNYLTNTAFTIWLPDNFNTEAKGTVSVSGSPVYTFNPSASSGGGNEQGGDIKPTVAVNGNKPLTKKPTVPFKPTFSGTAEPHAKITVTVHSDPVVCTTTADSTGKWSCTLSEALPAGTHTVYVHVLNPDNSEENLGPYSVEVRKDGTVPPITNHTKPNSKPHLPNFRAPNSGFLKQVASVATTPLRDASLLRMSVAGLIVIGLIITGGLAIKLRK